MNQLESGKGGIIGLIPIIIAVPIALIVVSIEPSLSLPLLVGSLVLIIGFLSPEAGLYVLVVSMLLGPEMLVGGIGSGATLGRGVTLRFDDLVLVLVALGWLARTAVSDGAGRFFRSRLHRPIMLYTAACVFATLMGILFGRVRPFGGFFFLLKYYEYFFIFFMAVNIIKTQVQVKRLLYVSLVTCALVTLYALAQIPSGVRVSAPFEGTEGEPNTLGGYLVFMMAIVTGFLLTPGSITKRYPLFILLGMSGLALQATLSRTSYLAAAAVLLVVLELARRRSAALFGSMLFGIFLLILIMPTSVINRVTYTFNQPEEAGQLEVGVVKIDTSTSERIRSWQDAMSLFVQSPLWGAGVTGGPFMDAMFPRVLTETGLLGFLAFLYLLLTIFQVGWSSLQETRDPFVRGLALGFLLGFLGLVFHSIGANTFIIVRIMEPFWLFTALVIKSRVSEEIPEEEGVVPPMNHLVVPMNSAS